MKKLRIKGSLIGVTWGESAPEKWRIRLSADCPVGKAGEIVTVQKAVEIGGEIEVEI